MSFFYGRSTRNTRCALVSGVQTGGRPLLVELVSNAELDGLDPDDYDPDELREVVKKARSGSSEALAKAVLILSRTFPRYVSDVRRKPSIKITYLDRELEPERLTEAAVQIGRAHV